MKYYLNITKRKLHTEKCWCVKQHANDKTFSENWIKFGSLTEAIKHCKKDGRQYKYCHICCGKDGGKIVK